MEKLIILSFHAFDAWHSSCWLSETLHAVSKDHFFHIDKTEPDSNRIKHYEAGFIKKGENAS